ncbi:MAG: hypothetical protein ACRDBO_01570 [Lachnospiraceae bacterium]
MKNILKGLIVFFTIMLLLLAGLLVYALTSGIDGVPLFGGIGIGFHERHLVNTQSVDMNDISSIHIKSSNTDVIFLTGDNEEMIIKEYNSQSKKNPFVTVSRDKKELNIKADDTKTTWRVFGYSYKYMEIHLP